jgi:hypothetical protein
MKNAWDNVIYTCSNMLIFENVEQIESWALRHNIPQGDIQPLEKIWTFSKKWYGEHLNPAWTKWTVEEAKQIFMEFELDGKIWNLDDSKERYNQQWTRNIEMFLCIIFISVRLFGNSFFKSSPPIPVK